MTDNLLPEDMKLAHRLAVARVDGFTIEAPPGAGRLGLVALAPGDRVAGDFGALGTVETVLIDAAG